MSRGFEWRKNRASNATRPERKAIYILFSGSFRCWQLYGTGFAWKLAFLSFHRGNSISNNTIDRRFIVVLPINHRMLRFHAILPLVNRNCWTWLIVVRLGYDLLDGHVIATILFAIFSLKCLAAKCRNHVDYYK